MDISHIMLSKKDLCQLRTVNRTFCNMTTPALFKSITVRSNDRSTRRSMDLLYAPDIAGHVQSITFIEGMFSGKSVLLYYRLY
jgi:hypothetical protein